MATGSLLAGLLRRSRRGNPMATNLRALPLSHLESVRSLSSSSSRGEALAAEEEPAAPPDDLRSRLFRVRFPKRSATAALDKWVGEGRKVTASELRQIAKDLKRSQRYKHALESCGNSPITGSRSDLLRGRTEETFLFLRSFSHLSLCNICFLDVQDVVDFVAFLELLSRD